MTSRTLLRNMVRGRGRFDAPTPIMRTVFSGETDYMALKKCPKCELNYIREDEEYCNVCLRSMKKRRAAAEPEEEERICSECGEAPAVKGHDLCEACLKEQKRQEELENIILLETEDGEPFEDADADEEEEED